ncbi:MAG: histidine triad nucleotide-binding protein [Planctomycetota bacterium]|nr:histidine triad nucleotide-binding protein [Planctomycetota bacterium]
MTKTLFAKIADGEIPAEIVYEDDRVVAFKDIQPQAPIHFLVIPRKPIASLATADQKDTELLGHCLSICASVAQQEGLTESGYRVVTNIGEDGGQTVPHLHFHILGGRSLQWPPG